MPSRDTSYLAELRSAFDLSGVQLECFLIDDGDLTNPAYGAESLHWISTWVDVAEELGVQRTRVIAGKQPPTDTALRLSTDRLRTLADRHPGTRIVIENWHALMADSTAVASVLDGCDGRVGFLVDLGNWTGPDKYEQLAAVAGRAETCQAKVLTDDVGDIVEDDFLRSLHVLAEARYAGPLALVHDGPDDDEWGKLDEAFSLTQTVFTGSRRYA